MLGCGAFLFAYMSAENPSLELIVLAGFAGSIPGVLSVVSEIYTVTREQRRPRTQSQLERPAELVMPARGGMW